MIKQPTHIIELCYIYYIIKQFNYTHYKKNEITLQTYYTSEIETLNIMTHITNIKNLETKKKRITGYL